MFCLHGSQRDHGPQERSPWTAPGNHGRTLGRRNETQTPFCGSACLGRCGKVCLSPLPPGSCQKGKKAGLWGAPAAPTQHGSVPRQPRRAVDGAPLARPSSPRRGRVCVSSKSLLRQDAGFFLLDIIRGMRRILVWKYCFLWIGVCVTDA